MIIFSSLFLEVSEGEYQGFAIKIRMSWC